MSEEDNIPGSEEEEDGDGLPEQPEFLRDEAPDPDKKKSMYVKWALMHGKLEDTLIAEGANPNTVRIGAQELEKEGYRQRPARDEKYKNNVAVHTQSKGIQIFAKGSPPEALIESLDIPISGADGFQSGMKFGASMIVLGVRVAQELSSIGIQQAKPIMDMAREMRSGEAAAAKGAATEAAEMAASEVGAQLLPHLAAIGKGSEADPMKAMMVRTMEPIVTRMMGKMIPGGAPTSADPAGWTRKQVSAPKEDKAK